MFLSSLANDNNNDILCLPLAVFIALIFTSGAEQIPQTNISNETYSTGHRHCNLTHVFHACKSAILHANSTRKTREKHSCRKIHAN